MKKEISLAEAAQELQLSKTTISAHFPEKEGSEKRHRIVLRVSLRNKTQW